MLPATVLVILSGMLCTLRLSCGSFPKPLSAKEEAHYLARGGGGIWRHGTF